MRRNDEDLADMADMEKRIAMSRKNMATSVIMETKMANVERNVTRDISQRSKQIWKENSKQSIMR